MNLKCRFVVVVFFPSKAKTILLYRYGVICVTRCIVTKYLRTSIRFQQKLVTVSPKVLVILIPVRLLCSLKCNSHI